ncbi:MAG TPA: DinB family protein [Thermoanaerobaculia bacterium]|jgi:hypothetical protein
MDLKSFAKQYEREHAVTRKVLAAYPAEQASFKPHERSSSALTLAQTFVVEERLMLLALRNEPVLGGIGFSASPTEWDAVLAAFDAQSKEMMELLGRVTEAELQPVKFFSGPGAMQDYPAAEFLWFMLLDQIHHRGQMSVYLRMAGGKVPSIYGPTADEPWT